MNSSHTHIINRNHFFISPVFDQELEIIGCLKRIKDISYRYQIDIHRNKLEKLARNHLFKEDKLKKKCTSSQRGTNVFL